MVSERVHGSLAACIALSLVGMLGCFNSDPKGTVSGKVTYNGQPVPEGCLVTFLSNLGAALGTTNATGDYQLIMAGSPNVPVGAYDVSVVYPLYQGPVMTDEEEQQFNAGDPSTVAKFSQKSTESVIPKKYSDPNLSGLAFEIQKGPNIYDIELK